LLRNWLGLRFGFRLGWRRWRLLDGLWFGLGLRLGDRLRLRLRLRLWFWLWFWFWFRLGRNLFHNLRFWACNAIHELWAYFDELNLQSVGHIDMGFAWGGKNGA